MKTRELFEEATLAVETSDAETGEKLPLLAVLQLHLLMDIRELLQRQVSPKVKHAECAEPPEVKIV